MRHRRTWIAVGWAVPIGTLGGLIGLGGGEFRLPVLVHGLGYSARAAVPLNLVVSLATLAAALAVRAHTLALEPVISLAVEVSALALGGLIGAAWAAQLLVQWPDRRLHGVIVGLLFGLGCLLIVEALLPGGLPPLVTGGAKIRFVIALGLGLFIGGVSALLGVAGGELLIPTLVFVFGADIKAAGTASLAVSLVMVAAGLWRYRRLKALPDRASVSAVALPMAAASTVGAVVGGVLAGLAPAPALKVFLGALLVVVAAKGMRRP